MELISGLALIIAATVITTWYNDHVSTEDYIAEEG